MNEIMQFLKNNKNTSQKNKHVLNSYQKVLERYIIKM